jgi:hypothetical protein
MSGEKMSVYFSETVLDAFLVVDYLNVSGVTIKSAAVGFFHQVGEEVGEFLAFILSAVSPVPTEGALGKGVGVKARQLFA